MTIEYFIPEWMLKRAAKRLSKEIDITHSTALNALAIEQGFRNWAELKQEGDYYASELDPIDWIVNATSKITAALEFQ